MAALVSLARALAFEDVKLVLREERRLATLLRRASRQITETNEKKCE